ncbi:MAG: ATP-binding cassette domain-containing protein [Flavobacterium sp.]|nr:ATP-binding cassette domain-containing protein [Flavobacterium sp.]
MAEPVIKVENISKAYQIGQIGSGTLSRDIDRFWQTKILGKEDPFLKIGETNDRSVKGESDIVWSLKDINFEINQGEALGIIGKNGAGKSTLLKLLSRVTSPTTGEIKVKGRIASLLEVGTGFHPELSGRENIYLNGAILGMRKKEITRKLDEIIAFSGVERYIDTPVKRYSSGMYVRLAFAVAAHLESEILIVDEVLAVGDAEFQKKCLGKMGDISKGEGRTILFVSHNMNAIQNLCSKVLILNNGQINFNGNVDSGLKQYLNSKEINSSIEAITNFMESQEDSEFKFLHYDLFQSDIDDNNFFSEKDITLKFEYQVKSDIAGLRVGFDLIDIATEQVLFRSFNDDDSDFIATTPKGIYSSTVVIPALFLKEGIYAIKFSIGIHSVRWLVHDNDLTLTFFVTNKSGVNKAYLDNRPGVIMPQLKWTNIKVE